MKKILKILLWSVLTLVVLLGLLLAGFIYKIHYGFPVSYETAVPNLNFPENQKTVLLFSKTTGFRHSESIEVSKKVFSDLADKNNWFLFSTEEGGVFNPTQLSEFDVVIFNNSTGRVLNDEQRKTLEDFVEKGGQLIGIHGAGDNSHHWNWYEENFIGVEFSHHSLNPQLQKAAITLQETSDSLLTQNLSNTWTHTDEWYVFYENPREKGFQILYSINGEEIISNGNILWIKDKDFGMGRDHPVAWYKNVGKGSTFYTSIGHDATAWSQAPFIQMLENAINLSY